MTKRTHDYQYYKDVARAAFAESLRQRGFITTELRGAVGSCAPRSTWTIPIEDPKPTLELLETMLKKAKEGTALQPLDKLTEAKIAPKPVLYPTHGAAHNSIIWPGEMEPPSCFGHYPAPEQSICDDHCSHVDECQQEQPAAAPHPWAGRCLGDIEEIARLTAQIDDLEALNGELLTYAKTHGYQKPTAAPLCACGKPLSEHKPDSVAVQLFGKKPTAAAPNTPSPHARNPGVTLSPASPAPSTGAIPSAEGQVEERDGNAVDVMACKFRRFRASTLQAGFFCTRDTRDITLDDCRTCKVNKKKAGESS